MAYVEYYIFCLEVIHNRQYYREQLREKVIYFE